jgi:RNA polymerase sigma factor (sigma-70 family)
MPPGQSKAVPESTDGLTRLSDEQLALGIRNGRPGHLDLLVERYHAPLLGFVYRMTDGNRPLAEDLVQETFLRLLSRIGTYGYPRPLKPWLYAISVNLVRDHYKKADTRHTDPLANEVEPSSSETAESQFLSDEQGREIAAAIKALPLLQKEALIMRYFQELSLKEIAQILQVPVGTVKSRLSLGMKRLKENLDQDR